MIELSLTIEIYIAGVKNRAGFATAACHRYPSGRSRDKSSIVQTV